MRSRIMTTVAIKQQNKIHPHKFALWIAIGSIMMMFAGLTSAYILKRSQAGWISFDLPAVFWVSTVAIILSSVMMILSVRAFKERKIARYRTYTIVSLCLGLVFIVLQIIGFVQLWNSGLTLQSSVSYSFLYVIVGIHAVHVLGGIVVLIVMAFQAFNNKKHNYSLVPVQLASTYWHFVDILWIYLLVFLLLIK